MSRPDERARILIVEDDPGNRQALRAILRDPGYGIEEVASGEEALRRVLEEDYAVILLDIHLPGMDGFDTATLIRKRRRSCRTPIIFLTGVHPDRSHMFKGYEVGAVDYMIKPVIPEVLRSKVAVFVELHNKSAQIAAQNEILRALAQRSEKRFYELVQGLDAIVWEGDVNHRFTFVSQRAQEILGYSLEAWVSGRRFRANLIHAGDRAAAFRAYQRAARERQSTVIEYRALRADGQVVWMRDHVHVVPNGGEDAVQLRGVMVDVSAQKQNEKRLQEQAEELALADRNRNEFLAMLGHELRNPLAPIQSAVEWLRLQQAQGGADIGWGIEAIGRQVEHMTRLVGDLLDVARITRGKIELERKRLDLNDVVARATETVRPLIQSRRHALDTALAPEPVYVDGDSVRLAQVVSNLLHNAAKYTEEGGRLRVGVERAGGSAIVRVSDNGVGISPDMLARVFDLFTQVSVEPKLSGGGLGVGLSLVRSLVEMHGGRVEARSAGPGCGSEFLVHLPLSVGATAPAGAEAPRQAAQTALRGRRILVVDDNEDAATSLGRLLQALGHQVAMAGDGRDALAAVQSFKPNVVFLDIGLPGMDGYEVARRLTTNGAGRPARLVALTGFGKPNAEQPGAELFDHFLLKPADLRAIEQVLERL